MGKSRGRWMRVLTMLTAWWLALGSSGGCGKETPFPLEQVRGTVTYEDGSLIPADKIRIVFEPQDVPAQREIAPRAAETYADVSDGSFGNFTTWKYGDGVIVGRHRVTVMSLRLGQHGVGEPTSAVPPSYHRAATTPLEAEVVSGGKNYFTFEIAKGTSSGPPGAASDQ